MKYESLGDLLDLKRLDFMGLLMIHYLKNQQLQPTPRYSMEEPAWFQWEYDNFSLWTPAEEQSLTYYPGKGAIEFTRRIDERKHSITVDREGSVEYLDEYILKEGSGSDLDEWETAEVRIKASNGSSQLLVAWRQRLFLGESLPWAVRSLLEWNERIEALMSPLSWAPTGTIEDATRLMQKRIQRIPPNVIEEFGIDPSGRTPIPKDVAERMKAKFLPDGTPPTWQELVMVGIQCTEQNYETNISVIWETEAGIEELPAFAREQLQAIVEPTPQEFEPGSGRLALYDYDLEYRFQPECEQAWTSLRMYGDIAVAIFPILDQFATWYNQQAEMLPGDKTLYLVPTP